MDGWIDGLIDEWMDGLIDLQEDKTKRATDPYLKELNTFQVQVRL